VVYIFQSLSREVRPMKTLNKTKIEDSLRARFSTQREGNKVYLCFDGTRIATFQGEVKSAYIEDMKTRYLEYLRKKQREFSPDNFAEETKPGR
jgi:hypothetical protein